MLFIYMYNLNVLYFAWSNKETIIIIMNVIIIIIIINIIIIIMNMNVIDFIHTKSAHLDTLMMSECEYVIKRPVWLLPYTFPAIFSQFFEIS